MKNWHCLVGILLITTLTLLLEIPADTWLTSATLSLILGTTALAYMAEQHGMFSMLKLTADQIGRLRADHGVYMAGSGRINVAGLQVADIPAFVRKLRAVGFGNAA